MNLFTVTLATMAVFASSSIDAQTLVITRDGSRDVRQAPMTHSRLPRRAMARGCSGWNK
jgi:hypothetical protein